MAETSAILDGVQLEVDSGAKWEEVPGVDPFYLYLEVDSEAAGGIFDKASLYGSSLTLTSNGKTFSPRLLSILGTSPTSNPNTLQVMLADPRWTWPYRYYWKRFNVRRKGPSRKARTPGAGSGATTVTGDARAALEVRDDDVIYAGWSLKDGRAWTLKEIFKDVLDHVLGDVDWRDPDNVLGDELPEVEGLLLNGAGDTVIRALLAAAGGGVGITYNAPLGQFELYRTMDGGEFEQAGIPQGTVTKETKDGLVRPLFGPPLRNVQNNKLIRPSKIRVLFDRLTEIRLELKENTFIGGPPLDVILEGKGGSIGSDGPPFCVNVFPMPEDGDVPAFAGGTEFVVAGTWVTLSQLLSYYASNPLNNTLAFRKPLTKERLQGLWFSDALAAYGSQTFDATGRWAARVAVLREHYRRTWKVSQPWADRIKRLDSYRVAVENVELIARGPAAVYQDYTVLQAWDPLTSANLIEREFELLTPRYAIETGVIGRPATDTEEHDTKDMRLAPATVAVLDQDQLVFSVTFGKDWTGFAAQYIRTGISQLSKPGTRAGDVNFLLQDAELNPEHFASVVLTIQLAAPNDVRRFYEVEVTPADATKKLPGSASNTSADATTALGPELTIKVGNPKALARFGWDDDDRDKFYRAFAEEETPVNDVGTGLRPIDLGDPINLDELQEIALATAARAISAYTNHPEGEWNVDFTPSSRVRGTVSKVVHMLEGDAQGGATTKVELAPQSPTLDAAALLTPDVRRVLEGFVEP